MIYFYEFYAYSAARVFSGGNLVDDFTVGPYISKLGELNVKGDWEEFVNFDHKSEVSANLNITFEF